MLRLDVAWQHPERPVILAFDSEWTKNYRVRNGNRPFCFSVVALDARRSATEQSACAAFARYVDDLTEIPNLVQEADRMLGELRKVLRAQAIVGHQLSSDLAALINFSQGAHLPALQALRSEWRVRRGSARSRIVDTRYDLNAHLHGTSRRLVDVCHEFALVVDQPELGRASMTKLQNTFLQSGDPAIRERLLVLNLRHSLSCALVFARSRAPARGQRPINVNRMLRQLLAGRVDYVGSAAFEHLLA